MLRSYYDAGTVLSLTAAAKGSCSRAGLCASPSGPSFALQISLYTRRIKSYAGPLEYGTMTNVS